MGRKAAAGAARLQPASSTSGLSSFFLKSAIENCPQQPPTQSPIRYEDFFDSRPARASASYMNHRVQDSTSSSEFSLSVAMAPPLLPHPFMDSLTLPADHRHGQQQQRAESPRHRQMLPPRPRSAQDNHLHGSCDPPHASLSPRAKQQTLGSDVKSPRKQVRRSVSFQEPVGERPREKRPSQHAEAGILVNLSPASLSTRSVTDANATTQNHARRPRSPAAVPVKSSRIDRDEELIPPILTTTPHIASANATPRNTSETQPSVRQVRRRSKSVIKIMQEDALNAFGLLDNFGAATPPMPPPIRLADDTFKSPLQDSAAADPSAALEIIRESRVPPPFRPVEDANIPLQDYSSPATVAPLRPPRSVKRYSRLPQAPTPALDASRATPTVPSLNPSAALNIPTPSSSASLMNPNAYSALAQRPSSSFGEIIESASESLYTDNEEDDTIPTATAATDPPSLDGWCPEPADVMTFDGEMIEWEMVTGAQEAKYSADSSEALTKKLQTSPIAAEDTSRGFSSSAIEAWRRYSQVCDAALDTLSAANLDSPLTLSSPIVATRTPAYTDRVSEIAADDIPVEDLDIRNRLLTELEAKFLPPAKVAKEVNEHLLDLGSSRQQRMSIPPIAASNITSADQSLELELDLENGVPGSFPNYVHHTSLDAFHQELPLLSSLAAETHAVEDKNYSDDDSDVFESADEGSEDDWGPSRRASAANWFIAAEIFERAHGCARGPSGSSWRSSVRISKERSRLSRGPTALAVEHRVQSFTDSKVAARRLSLKPTEGLRIDLNHSPPLGQRVDESQEEPPHSPTCSAHHASQSTLPDTPLMTPPMDPQHQELESTGEFPCGLPSPLPKINKQDGEGLRSPLCHSTVSPGSVTRQQRSPSHNTRPVSINSPGSLEQGLCKSKRRSVQTGARGGDRRRSVHSQKRLTMLLNSTNFSLVEPPNHISWRNIIPDVDYREMLACFGTMEMHRQEVLWELCETEKLFVQSLCGIHGLFALPLKSPSGDWIKGVPASIARLFDWLEDILRLHSKLAVAMQKLRVESSGQGSNGKVIIRFADSIAKYITKLELHLPYLLRFESVIGMVEDMVAAPQNEFGQFIRMQMLAPECGKLSFSSFLLKPVQRLMKYPLFFKQLLEVTPSGHPDYESTRNLYALAERIVRDMNDVKAREEEYHQLEALSKRIDNLPEALILANRDRKLIHQGRVSLIPIDTISPRSCSPLEPSLPEHAMGFLREAQSPLVTNSPSPSDSGSSLPFSAPYPSPRLSDGAAEPSSRSTARRSLLMSSRFLRSPRSPTDELQGKAQQVHAFVFSDLLILTSPSDEDSRLKKERKRRSASPLFDDQSNPTSRFRVLSSGGIGRVLDVNDVSDRAPGHRHLLRLEVLPLRIGADVASADGTKSYLLSFDRQTDDRRVATLGPEGECTLWHRALERSLLSAVQQTQRGRMLDKDLSPASAHADWQRRKDQVANLAMAAATAGDRPNLIALLQSGLPFPKSPSQQELVQAASEQLRQVNLTQEANQLESRHLDCKGCRIAVIGDNVLDEVEEEQEERRWWSLRLSEIRRERQLECDLDQLIERRKSEAFRGETVLRSPPTHNRMHPKIRYLR